jgi:hypothetical protein
VLVAIFLIQRRYATDPLWPKPCPAAERTADVKWHSHKSNVILADFAHVFEIRRLQKCADPTPVGSATTLKTTDFRLILDGISRLEPQLLDTANILLPLCRGYSGFVALGFHALVFAQVGKRPAVFPAVRGVLLIKRHGAGAY